MKKLLIIPFAFLLLSACTPDDTGPRAFLGNPMATILIEEFSDYECPACAVVSSELEEIVLRNSDKVLFHFYHFPLSRHLYAFKAAEAAECANDLGKYWEYAALLFDNQRNLNEDNLKLLAGQLGLDPAVFDECLDSGVKKARVKADLYEGRARQVSYTPSVYVNGELVKWSGAEEFEAYVKSL